MKRSFITILLLMASMAVPKLSRAASLTINDTNPNDTIVFNVNDFENGFSVAGFGQIQIGLGNPQSLTVPEGNGPVPIVYSFTGSWVDDGQTTPTSQTIVFLENGDPNNISDILTYSYSTANGNGTLSGTFVSDVDGGNPLVAPDGDYTTTNNESWVFDNAFISAQALSDTDTPEPATFGLLTIALGALGLVGRRRVSRG